MPRQSRMTSSCDPMTGARIGARPFTNASRDSIRTRGSPPKRSRTMAMATTPPAAAPKPWSTRNTPRVTMSGANATPRDAATCSEVASTRGSRRPTRSLQGPTSNCPNPKPTAVAVSVSWMTAVDTPKSLSRAGNAGR